MCWKIFKNILDRLVVKDSLKSSLINFPTCQSKLRAVQVLCSASIVGAKDEGEEKRGRGGPVFLERVSGDE